MMDEYLGGVWPQSYVDYFIRIKYYFSALDDDS